MKYLARMDNGRYTIVNTNKQLAINRSIELDMDDVKRNAIIIQVGIGEFMPQEERFVVLDGQVRGCADEYPEPHMQ